MNAQQATDWFLGLPGKWQARFVALLLHNLTVAARGTYEPQTENLVAPSRLRHYNEIIHRVIGFLLDVFEADEDRYTGDFWIADMLFVDTDDKELDGGCRRAFKTSAGWIDRQIHGPESLSLQGLETPKRIGA